MPGAAEVPRKPVYLLPGEVYASAEPALVTTVLGSCVAVCLWDPVRRIGGANHFLLPHQVNGAAGSSPRFGPQAMDLLLSRLETLGACRSRLTAKVFGGSCVLVAAPLANAIGAKNVLLARQLLEERGIPVAAHETGGARGRRLVFETDTGHAKVKVL